MLRHQGIALRNGQCLPFAGSTLVGSASARSAKAQSFRLYLDVQKEPPRRTTQSNLTKNMKGYAPHNIILFISMIYDTLQL